LSTTVNVGNQVLLYSYKQEVTSEGFNQLNHKLHPHGIYSGAEVTKVDENNILISPTLCVFEIPENKATVRIETNSDVSLFVTQVNKYVVLRFDWKNTEFNFMDIKAISEIDIRPLDLVVCKCIYENDVLIGFDYSRKSWSYNHYNKIANYDPPFKVIAHEPYDQSVRILPGGPYIFNGKILQVSNEIDTYNFTFPIPVSGRKDVLCLDSASNVIIVTGTSLSLPIIKTDYFPIAIITFPANTTISTVRGDYITYIHPNQFLSSEIYTSTLPVSDTYVKRDVDGSIRASHYISNVATGTAPLTVTSTTKVANLNADLFDGLTSTDFVRTTGNVEETITGNKTFSQGIVFSDRIEVNGLGITSSTASLSIFPTNVTELYLATSATNMYVGASTSSVLFNGNITVNDNLYVGEDNSTHYSDIQFLGTNGAFNVGTAAYNKTSTFNGPVGINGTLTINGNIIQNGSTYETHAEKLYTTKDRILTRDGATSSLGAGEISGLEVIKYDGVDNLLFGTDNSGFFKVGEAGSLQILATRNDTMTTNAIPYWNSTNNRFDSSTATIVGSTITGSLTGNASGYSGSVKSPNTTGLIRFTGMLAGTTRDKTVRDANDTILELAGSYTPTGTWTSLRLNEAVALTTTSTKLNYLTSATGTTGTASTNIVFSTNPTITGLRLAQGAFYIQIDPTTLAANGTLTLAAGATTLTVGTMVPDSRTITIANGTGITGGGAAVNLSANRSWTIGLTGLALAYHNITAVDGIIAKTGAATVAARTITGTNNRITVTNGGGAAGNPTIDIASTYVGQNTITTLGTISTGTWNATTIGVNKGGTGQTTFLNGELLIGNTTGNTLTKATLTQGTGVTITNGAGSITLAIGQAVATTSNVQFNTINLGHATDTTLSRSAAGRLAVEGVNVITASSIDTLTNKTITEIGGVAATDNRLWAQTTTGNTQILQSVTTGTITIGGASLTGTITIGLSTSSHQIYIGNGAIDSGTTKTIAIGANSKSGSTTNILLGSGIAGALGSIYARHKLLTLTSSATSAGLNLPHGVAPTTPADGDVWTTTTGIFARINGATINLSASMTGYVTLAGNNTFTGTNTFNNTVTFTENTILDSTASTTLRTIWIV